MLLYKKFYSEKYEIPLDKIKVEYQILKRKISENFEYPIPRISKFVPANGKPSVKRAWDGFMNFVDSVYDDGGNVIQEVLRRRHRWLRRNYKKIVSTPIST